MIELDENVKKLQELKQKNKELGESLWHNKFKRWVIKVRSSNARTKFLDR